MSHQADIDTGTAYGMKAITADKRLTQVGPGTPMGELMRRYWQPFFTSEQLTSDKPHRVRLLGENLIAFRDKSGRPGLVYEHCLHRGTSLYYGRIENDGIRCCNHGWKFDCKGNCLEQPAEPGGGRALNRYRQPWYPVEERYGLVYAFMGPPGKKPVLPRWQHLEGLEPDERLEVRSRPGFGNYDSSYEMMPLDINWLPALEQTMDGAHVPWLHYHHSGDQFTGVKLTEIDESNLPPYGRVKEIAASMVTEWTERGVTQGFPMPGPDGQLMLSCNEAVVPNIGIVPGFFDMMYVVPADDEHYYTFFVLRSREGHYMPDIDERHDGKTWWEMTEQERRAMPGDYEAQHSIPAPASTFEHFCTSDKAIVNWRKRLEEALVAVEEGRDPVGISYDPGHPPLQTGAFGLRPMKPAEIGKLKAIPGT